MKLSLFDLHCDTPYEMFRQKQSLDRNHLAVSLQEAEPFERYVQVMAFWTESDLSDAEGWQRFLQMHQNLLSDAAVANGRARITRTYSNSLSDQRSLILAVEDARILENDLSRVDILKELGVRILTPLWANNSCIGGAHNTQNGLTVFGKKALRKALSNGILLDISHASVRAAQEIAELCKESQRPILATHSNAYEICPVSRNLHNEQIRQIIDSDGLIGLNLYQGFIKQTKKPTLDDLLFHIEHFLTLGAIDHLCIGGDMDGCDLLDEIPKLSALPRLAEKLLQKNYPERLIHKFFFENADRFAKKYFTK